MACCQQAGEDVYETFKPGGRLHPTYFLEHKGHLVVEAVFLAVIAYLTLHPRAPHRSRKQETPLTEQARSLLFRQHPQIQHASAAVLLASSRVEERH